MLAKPEAAVAVAQTHGQTQIAWGVRDAGRCMALSGEVVDGHYLSPVSVVCADYQLAWSGECWIVWLVA